MLQSKFTTLVTITILWFGIGWLFIHASSTDENKTSEEFNQYYRIYSLSIPPSLLFAGEPVPLNDIEVAERFDKEILTNVYWQSQTILMLKRANRFFPVIEPILKKNGIPDDFKFLAIAESGLQNVTSPAGASGYWQFLDKTAQRYGLEVNEEIDERLHIEKSTEAACKYFKEAFGEFKNWALVAASYNMGIEGVKKQMQLQRANNYYDLYLNTETARYVLRAIAFKQIMQNPKQFGFYVNAKHLYSPIVSARIKVTEPISDLAQFALTHHVNYKTMKIMNPWLRKNTLTNASGKTYYIAIPKDKLSEEELLKQIATDTIQPFPADSTRQ